MDMQIYRLNLKTNAENREDLIQECLHRQKFVAIGWSYLYNDAVTRDQYNIHIPGGMQEYLQAVRAENSGKLPRAVSTFHKVEKDDIIWTRDLNGEYFLCRVLSKPEPYCDKSLDIGCIIKVDVVSVGTNAPGKVIRCFSIPGTMQRICNDSIEEYSKVLYNRLSGQQFYSVSTQTYDFFEFISPMDLEELVLIYLQVEKGYYLSKNSIAPNSTTVKIEAELFSRTNGKSAVVQVKSGRAWTEPKLFVNYTTKKEVFLFFQDENYGALPTGVTGIKKDDLISFVKSKKTILPPNIRMIANVCGI
jgi:hypothetical protein